MNLPIQDHPNEPRRSPPGGNDPSPHGSFDLKGRAHLEGGYERICEKEIESWIYLWACFSALMAFSEVRQRILRKMNKRRVLKRLSNPVRRERILDAFNRENMDDVGQSALLVTRMDMPRCQPANSQEPSDHSVMYVR